MNTTFKMKCFLLVLLWFPLCKVNANESNLAARYIVSDNIFEQIEEIIGKEKFRGILNEEKGRWLYVGYNLNGELTNIDTGIILGRYQRAYFLEEEWEQIFDYFHDLPPLPISNPIDYNWEENKIYNSDLNLSIERIANKTGNSFECGWIYGNEDGNIRNKSYPQNMPFYDWFKNTLYNYDFSIRGENPDSLFGKIRWETLRSIYFDKYNAGELKPLLPKYMLTLGEHFKQSGYCWEKIPINNYTVNLQVPIDSKITIAPDTLSAEVDFPDSTYVFIQYTKGLPYTKLWEGEENPRKRLIDEISVNSLYLYAKGYFMNNDDCINWERIRYRYGVTITIYSKCKNRKTDYYKTVIIPATIVMRPKFKNLYLAD